MPVFIDESKIPLIFVRFEGTLTDASLGHYHAETIRLLQRARQERRKYAWVIDSGTSEGTTSRQRQEMANFAKEHQALIQAASAGSAVIHRNAIQRGVHNAFNWMLGRPMSIYLTPTIEDATRWARARLISENHTTAPLPRRVLAPGLGRRRPRRMPHAGKPTLPLPKSRSPEPRQWPKHGRDPSRVGAHPYTEIASKGPNVPRSPPRAFAASTMRRGA